MMSDNKVNVLSFDIEDWYHLLDNESTKSPLEWEQYPSRIELNTKKILELLAKNNQKATFFCLGYIAKNNPDVIKAIANAGHEIGCHSNLHQLIYELSPKTFFEDTDIAVKTLENITGKKVISYRAPGFSITHQTKWAFEILIELGIERDSSIFPAKRAHGGFPGFGSDQPSLIRLNGSVIKEFPINLGSFLGKKIVYSGGGYFRLLPYILLDYFFKQDAYVMTYFHPRDFDPRQPMVPGLSLHRKFKSYIGLKSAYIKLNKLIENHTFIDLNTADNQIDWTTAKTVSFESSSIEYPEKG